MSHRIIALLAIMTLAVAAVFGCGQSTPPPTDETASSWTEQLHERCRGADRLVIQPDFMAPEEDDGEPRRPESTEIHGADRIAALVAAIEIDDAESGFGCGCGGEESLTFYRGTERLVRVSFHHEQSLRWYGGPWDGDGLLTKGSRVAILTWLADNGYSDAQARRDAELAYQRDREAVRDRFLSFFPVAAREALVAPSSEFDGIKERDAAIGARVAELVPDTAQLAEAVARALGAMPSAWNTTGELQRRVLHAVRSVPVEDFVAALDALGDDAEALRGAARVFFGEGFDQALLDEPQPYWAERLARTVLETGMDENTMSVLRTLRRHDAPSVRALLHEVLSGTTGRERAFAPEYDENPGIRAGAALTLARFSDPSIRAVIEPRLEQELRAPDRAAYEIALALLGDFERITAEHFGIRSFLIGEAGLAAIEHFDGAYGMQALVDGALEHPWPLMQERAVLTFQRITGETWYRNQRNIRASSYVGKIRDWWSINSARFVAERRRAYAEAERDQDDSNAAGAANDNGATDD